MALPTTHFFKQPSYGDDKFWRLWGSVDLGAEQGQRIWFDEAGHVPVPAPEDVPSYLSGRTLWSYETYGVWKLAMRRAARYYRKGMFPPNKFTRDRYRGRHCA